MYGQEMSMPLDIQLGLDQLSQSYGCRTEYVEWLRNALRDAHSIARYNLKKAAVRQKRSYRETTQTLQLKRGDWVWRNYPKRESGKLLPRKVDLG